MLNVALSPGHFARFASAVAEVLVLTVKVAQLVTRVQLPVTCTQYWAGEGEPVECETTFVGQVADGDACTIDDDCAVDTSYCDETTNVCTAN